MRCSGFSLVELLIVLAIVSILFSLSLGSLREENKDAKVQAEAERLAAVLRQTRNRSIASRQSYGVVFNITNGRGTSGSVLNNWDGGHWYRVIGPDGANNKNFGSLPLAGVRGGAGKQMRNFPDFVESVRSSWVSTEIHRLPARSVRFLALSDTDEGPRRNYRDAYPAEVLAYDAGDSYKSYPRPWFGYYDKDSGVLYPWGGYHEDIHTSGFFYKHLDSNGAWVAVTNSVNPDTRIYNNNFFDYDTNGDGQVTGADRVEFLDVDINQDGDLDDLGERENGYVVWEQGEPRPLVHAEWLDACILFAPDGRAQYLEWCRGRRAYSNKQAVLTGDPSRGRNGVADRAKLRYPNPNHDSLPPHDFLYTDVRNEVDYSVQDNAGVAHFDRYTGGYHITLGPDILIDNNNFANVHEAMDTIDPAWRVFVGVSGVIRAFRVKRQRTDAGLPSAYWPSSKNDWFTSSEVFNRCRTGWLHEAETKLDENELRPAIDQAAPEKSAHPIIDVVMPRMLTDKIWWKDKG